MPDRIVKPDSGNDLVLQNDDASAKIEVNEAGTIILTGTSSIDVSGGTFTTSSAQKEAIVQAGPGSGTLDVSSGTFTTSSAQKTAIVDGGKGNLSASDVGLGNVTNESKATMFTSPTFSGTPNLGSDPTVTLGGNATFPAGHVISTQIFAGTGSDTTADWPTSAAYQTTGLTTGSISHGSGNKVLLIGSFLSNCSGGGYDKSLYVGLSGATSQIDSQFFFADSDDAQFWITIPYIHLDSPSGTATTYTVQIKASDGGNLKFNNTHSLLLVQVVQG